MKQVRKSIVRAVFLTACMAVIGIRARAQAVPTADRKSEISVFGGGSYIQPQPDFYSNNQPAVIVGADYTWFQHHFYVDPSLELRALISPMDEEVGERVYSGGLKVEHRYRALHPYGDFLVGSGTIDFQPNDRYYEHNGRPDNSIVLTYGGGVDLDVWRNFALKADYQGSRWHTGANVTFHPRSLNLAVVYRIKLKSR